MKKIISMIALTAAAVLFTGCSFSDPSLSAMRVGTYNIRYMSGDKKGENTWDERKADMANLIKKLNLDVFGLQEVMPPQTAYLSEVLPEFAIIGEYREKDRKSGEASPVCYRKNRFNEIKSGTFWLSETPEEPGVKGWGAACPRVCSWLILEDKQSGKRLCFANVHTDHASELAREKGMLLVIERMKEFGAGIPIVFVGDHNCRENDKPALAVSQTLRNALYETLTPPEGAWRTWNAWKWCDSEISTEDALKFAVGERNKCGPRIDYIYVSKDITVLDYKTHSDARPEKKLYPSDHFPVTATITF